MKTTIAILLLGLSIHAQASVSLYNCQGDRAATGFPISLNMTVITGHHGEVVGDISYKDTIVTARASCKFKVRTNIADAPNFAISVKANCEVDAADGLPRERQQDFTLEYIGPWFAYGFVQPVNDVGYSEIEMFHFQLAEMGGKLGDKKLIGCRKVDRFPNLPK